jgi:Tfp pilus assembly protein PilV
MIKKIKNILGLTILESIVSTAIVGIGFIAILQMTNFSVQSIDTSGERTKANYLVSMLAEDVIGHRNTIYGASSKAAGITMGIDGTINLEEADGSMTEVNKFVDHLVDTDFIANEAAVGACGDGTTSGAISPETNIYETQEVDAPRNKEAKWRAIFDDNRYLKCKGDRDIKKMKVYKICRWAGVCTHINDEVTDDGMYIGRIQVNLNNGRKRKYLYFQADYKIRK